MAKRRASGEGNIRKRADGHWEGRITGASGRGSNTMRQRRDYRLLSTL